MNDFAIFILSHGRPDKVRTVDTLERCNYSGDYYILCDDEDPTIEKYKENFGDKVKVFNKQKQAEKVDRGDNFDNREVILYARNKCFELAETLGYTYFMELDDDYTEFAYRFDENLEYFPPTELVEDLDSVLESLLDFYKKTEATTIAFAQGGDFIGGKNASIAGKLKIKRKAMNTFLCSTERPFQFIGSINEDVNSYTRLQQLGELMFTVNNISIGQETTQETESGMTDIYLEKGTYVKSFYTVLYNPSCVKLRLMGDEHQRIHHSIQWGNAVPKILSEDYKK